MSTDVTCCLDQSAKSCYLSLLPITAHSEQGHSHETSRTGDIKKQNTVHQSEKILILIHILKIIHKIKKDE